MDFDILNGILTDTVGSLFEDTLVYGNTEHTFKTYSP